MITLLPDLWLTNGIGFVRRTDCIQVQIAQSMAIDNGECDTNLVCHCNRRAHSFVANHFNN
jgi:hypothetical protein